jgi:hypothetical protein
MSPIITSTEIPVAVPSAPPILSRFKTTGVRAYSTLVNLPRKGKAIALTGLLLILVLVGTGLFSLAQLSPSMPIPYPPNTGSLALNDPLRANAEGHNWPDGITTDGGTCQFKQGAYHVSVTRAEFSHYCIAGATTFSNFAYEVHMTILKGDGGGLIFRADGTKGQFYYFHIGRDGSYALYLYTNTGSIHGQTLVSDITATVHTGLNIANVLAVVAHDNTIDLYVNGERINSIVNSANGSGQVGLAATYSTGSTEIVFSDAKVWTV